MTSKNQIGIAGKVIRSELTDLMKLLFQKTNRIYTLLVWLFIVFIIQGLLPGFVLCIEADGHIAVEFAHGGRCVTCMVKAETTTTSATEVLHASSPSEAAPNEDPCGPCVDISISIGRLDPCVVRQNMTLPLTTPMLTTSLFSQLASVKIENDSFLPSFPPVISPTLTSLRTIILLI